MMTPVTTYLQGPQVVSPRRIEGMLKAMLPLLLCSANLLAQRSPAPPPPTTPATSSPATSSAPLLPDIRQLLLDVERNEKAFEEKKKDYTYHVHLEEQELDGKGNLKKTKITDSESLSIDGVRVDRVVARDGKPLTPDETKKESERIDKEVARDRERRTKLESKGKETDSNGEEEITASRILELGTFSNPRRIDFHGRPTIIADYTGDPNAKTHNAAEAAFRDLVGVVWVDEQDHVLVRAQGNFIHDYKIGGGLIADIKKDSHFEAEFTKINDEAWLPTVVDGQGKMRFLLVAGFNGRLHLETSDYRKFRATSTIVGSNGVIGPDGKPDGQPMETPATTGSSAPANPK